MKKMLSLALVCALLLALLVSVASAEVPALKGPGNVTLKRLGGNVGFDVNANYMVDIIKQATGYDVEYFSLPAQNADEKLLMDVAGGADYDVINVNVNQWRTLMAQGALMPLNDLLDAYGQDILAGNSADAWKALSDKDGNIYGVPYMYPHSQEIASFMACRWDLMQAAGIESIPTTIDEFYSCLVALKDYYGDEYIIFSGPYKPASEGNENWVIPKTIACAFGIYSDWMVADDGSVYYMTEAPGFAPMIEFLTKLNNEGLLDPDWAVNTDSTVNEKFSSGRAIIACSNRAGVQVTTPAQMENLNLTYDDIGYIGALKGTDGTCTYMRTEAFNQISCILRSSKNAADAINWMNLKVQNQLFICIGVEGVHFNYDDKGMIQPINPIFANERGDSYWYIDATNQPAYEVQWPSRIRKSDAQWAAFNAITIKATAETPEIFVPNRFTFMPASEAFTKYNTSLFKSLQDFILQVLSGTRTIDDLATFQSDWANNGGEEVRAELEAYIVSQAE
ncbi:MAG TPA: extracellular solute-binding protein [Candidatus Limiplasma sp.]|nr:extracellular solute-binding protein [Candidatus Limiplasma sp.]